MTTPTIERLLKIEDLEVSYPVRGGLWSRVVGRVQAVNKVNIEIRKGEIVGLVGESGCGKSTLGKAILRLVEPTAGKIIFNDQSVRDLDGEDLRLLRRQMQMIFQDPYSSLNPRMKVGELLAEPYIIHQLAPKHEIRSRVENLLKVVGLRPESIDKRPHEFSGGQRQRIGIARALAVQPALIIADEPVSALDVSIQSQILNLLKNLQKEFNLTYLFISHDLNVVRYLCDRVIVMYMGRVMEVLDRDELQNPRGRFHPYTEALLSSIPRQHPRDPKNRIALPGDIPSPMNPPPGCVFHPRCREAIPECRGAEPPLRPLDSSRHLVACIQRP